MSEQRKSIGLDSSESPFLKGARFIVIPADLQQDFKACTGVVDSLDGYGAWLAPERKFHVFPKHEEVFLIEFDQRDVVTHRTRILKRDENSGMGGCSQSDPKGAVEAGSPYGATGLSGGR